MLLPAGPAFGKTSITPLTYTLAAIRISAARGQVRKGSPGRKDPAPAAGAQLERLSGMRGTDPTGRRRQWPIAGFPF